MKYKMIKVSDREFVLKPYIQQESPYRRAGEDSIKLDNCYNCDILLSKIEKLEKELELYKKPMGNAPVRDCSYPDSHCPYCSSKIFEFDGKYFKERSGNEFVVCFNKACCDIEHLHRYCGSCKCWWVEKSFNPKKL